MYYILKEKTRVICGTAALRRGVMESVGLGLIGAGVRSRQLLKHLVGAIEGVSLKAICDVSSESAESMRREYGTSETTCSGDYREMLNRKDVDWVLVCSPNHLHREQFTAAFEHGKHVFGEKPLATTIADCVQINEAHRASGKLFATGFVLRYAPLYQKVKELLDSGVIGRIVAVEASENIPAEHGGHIMTCWRRHKELSGSHILEKCCHDIDLLNWFVGSLPSRVASFGGLNVFTSDNRENLSKFTPPAGKDSVYLAWDIPSRDTQDPFLSEKTIVDNQVCIMEYRNEVRVTFITTMNNSIPQRRMYFSGTEGTLVCELYSNTLQVKRLGADEECMDCTFDSSDGHGGGDKIIAEQLADSMLHGTQPTCSGTEGLQSGVASLALEQARCEGCVVDIEDVWSVLGC